MKKVKTIIVSNRLPLKVISHENELKWQNSEGGLATGLADVYNAGDNIWIGWPGICDITAAQELQIDKDLQRRNLVPVYLTQSEIDEYYEGFSNETIWPLFHYFPSYAKFNVDHWNTYREVNQKFADAVLAHANPGDTIWIQDYQLLLLPAMIRERMPSIRIGFFQHIPFPSFEVFRQIPWRDELLTGLLGADLIGFHTFDDVRHFMSTAIRIKGVKTVSNLLYHEHRIVEADAFPMSIDFEKFSDTTRHPQTLRNLKKLDDLVGNKQLIISIDRLDYSKGIIDRLYAYDLFLKMHPEWKEKVVFIQIIVPSRDKVEHYASHKDDINGLVSHINAEHNTIGWQPIQYFYRSFPIHMLSALYFKADIALVSPIRDGMNLVCKEYIASKTNLRGVLILSEMAGAAKELYDAVIINPHDREQVASAIFLALTMPEEEQERRMQTMRQTVSQFNIHRWVANFMNELNEIKSRQEVMSTRLINDNIKTSVFDKYKKSKKRIFFLDYDGTLVAFNKNPDLASPDLELRALLNHLLEDERNQIVLISGRTKDSLQRWFGRENLDLVAEHGAWVRRKGEDWKVADGLENEWFNEVAPLFKRFAEKTPGAFVEEKSFSLAWHFRNVDSDLAEQRVYEMVSNLKYITAEKNLQILQGDKVVEVRSMRVNKGVAAKDFMAGSDFDFVLAIGDDFTDEDTFLAMPPSAITIKVGAGLSAATFNLRSPVEARSFLKDLISGVNAQTY